MRTRAPWRLTSAARYDRYSEALLPGWAQMILVLLLAAAAGWLVWHARSPAGVGDTARALAFLFPIGLAVVALLVRGSAAD